MKLIDRRSFVAGVVRQVLLTSAVLILCQIAVVVGQAQTILPLDVERMLTQHAAGKEESALSSSMPCSPNFDNLLVELWKADFSLEKSEFDALNSQDDSAEVKEKRKGKTDAVEAANSVQLPQRKDRQWNSSGGFNWNGAFKQSFIFLGVQHAFRLATEQGSRAELKGPFIKDYFKSLRSLRGWNDGDPFLVNYIGHPMMGAVSGYIQIQNDPKGIQEEVSLKKSYWKSRMKAMGWSFFYSTQFELGLVSEASLGNLGIRPTKKARNPMAYVDLVVTPVVGTSWLIGEDALDKYIIRRYEDHMPNRATRILFRSFLNPTRSFANVMRGKWPWFRDNRK